MNLFTKKLGAFAILIATIGLLKSQNPGDTIRVQTFHYKSNTRDTVAAFPKGNLTFEKIILKYNMRCKNALVSDQTNRSQGCGEWDYSCNTFIVDSSKIENEASTTPDYKVSNFSDTTFNYSKKPIYDYYDYSLNKVIINNASGESFYTVGTGTTNISNILKTDEKSGKTLMLYRASELSADGMNTGAINGLVLDASVGGNANFFKIRIKHTTANKLDPNQPDISGFTEVYYNSFLFVNGNNKIVFNTPFNWDGSSNVLVEFSFTNSAPSANIQFKGFSDTATCLLNAINNYALDLSSNGHVNLDASKMNTISKEISIAFWAYGDPKLLPANTSVIYGFGTNSNERQLNIHFPWSDGSVYFDCGFSAGSYDRVNKAATANEQSGKWNHWVFTKNSNTGSMKIFLNGNLWLAGTAKTKPMNILNLILGKDQVLQNNYKGKLNELSIWNKALSDTVIKAWINTSINNTHPNYSNLLAYYPMNEGIGSAINDNKYSLVSNGNNVGWTYERGANIGHGFIGSDKKPNLKFIRGTYNLTKTNILVKDSIERRINSIEKYSIVSKNGIIPITHDLVKLDTTYFAWDASPSNLYNGDSGTLKSTIANKSDGSYTVGKLNYIQRYPFYNEIMSFVTPYGIGIDLGAKGKSWYYDVSDYAPILKGNKRIVMTMGGQYQEQMDVEFLFIVGTPPRKVLEFNQIWQGAARLGGPGIGSILNDSRFAPVLLPILSAGKQFKMRSTITGHGSDGEFEQNGGVIRHYINFNGGANVLDWSLNIDCSTNPIVAQGGTWLIPRQGWCPGLKSLLTENNVTQYLSPGTASTIDYSISSPTKSGGDYRYLVAHQLVTYDDPSFNLDARILDIKAPNDNVVYAKTNPICAQPILLVQNSGKTKITTLRFNYWVNNSSVKQTWDWAGNLNSMDTISIHLPVWGLWANGLQASNNKFNVEISTVNTAADEYVLNNKMSSLITIPDVIPADFKLDVKTNNNPAENTFTLYDVDGKVVSTNTYTVANKTYSQTFNLNGCYKLVVTDNGQDGMNWWANAAQGTGTVKLKNISGSTLKNFGMDFGSFFEYNFTTNYALNENQLTLNQSINLYPNPASDMFVIEGENLQHSDIVVRDILGKTILAIYANSNSKIAFNTSGWAKGVYLVEITKDAQRAVKKVIVD